MLVFMVLSVYSVSLWPDSVRIYGISMGMEEIFLGWFSDRTYGQGAVPFF